MNSLFSVILHSCCTQIVARERKSRKIDKARGGGANVHPTAPYTVLCSVLSLSPICMRPECRNSCKYVKLLFFTEINVFPGIKKANSIITKELHIKGHRVHCTSIILPWKAKVHSENQALLLLVSSCRYSGNLFGSCSKTGSNLINQIRI